MGSVDLLLLTTCIATTLAMGGRTAIGQFTFLASGLCTAGLFFGVSLYRGSRVRPAWLDLFAMLGIALVFFQVTPLPTAVINTLSPNMTELLPAWGHPSTSEELPTWQTLSLAPRNTWLQLGSLTTAWLLVIVARHRLADTKRAYAFLDLLCVFGVLLALFGIVQFVASNGKFFWMFEHPHTTTFGAVKASFSNPNHFGGFLNLILLWPLWRILGPVSAEKDEFGRTSKWVWLAPALAIAVVLPAILMTQSRAALICSAVAITATFLLAHLLAGKKGGLAGRGLILVGVMLAVCVIGLTVFADQVETSVNQNLVELTSADIDQLDSGSARRDIWNCAIEGFKDYPVLGIGLGAHGSTYQRYWEGSSRKAWFSHVENGPLQVAFELGGTGLAIVALLLGGLLFRLVKGLRWSDLSDQKKVVVGLGLSACCVNLTHTMSDYVWHVPAYMFALVLILCSSFGQTIQKLGKYGPRIFPIAGCTAVVCGASLFGGHTWRAAAAEPSWNQYVRMTHGPEPSKRTKVMQLRSLMAAHRADPDHPGVNQALGGLYLWMFDVGQEHFEGFPLSDLRDVVRGGGWESEAQVAEWLADEAVAGRTLELLKTARYHATRCLALSPGNVRALRTLTKTNFLVDVTTDGDDLLYRQMLAISPTGPVSNFENGVEAWRRGDEERALECWKFAYQSDGKMQRAIGILVANLLEPDGLIELLGPSARQLQVLSGAYADQGNPEAEKELALRTARAWEQSASVDPTTLVAATELIASSRAYTAAERVDDSVRTARLAVEISPTHIPSRLQLAYVLKDAEQWEEAGKHFLWCSQQRGDAAGLRKLADRCSRLAREELLAAPDQPVYR